MCIRVGLFWGLGFVEVAARSLPRHTPSRLDSRGGPPHVFCRVLTVFCFAA